MTKHRFYIPETEWNPEQLRLIDDEARHCGEVMRCREGDRVVVFNGVGVEAEAEITGIRRGEIGLESRLVSQTPPLPAQITLGQAIPKGKNMDLIVQKATELGASKIVPLLSERTVVRIDAADLEKKRQKWQRVVIEACKQCGQNWLPTVASPVNIEDFVRSDRNELRLIAAIGPEARDLRTLLSERAEESPGRPSSASLMIGPEGDFTPAEQATSIGVGFAPLSLGPIILRSETAAIHGLSILGYELVGAGSAG